MRTSNFVVSPILLARYLLIVTAAVLILFGLVSFIRAHAIPPLANIYAWYGALMIGDAAVMLICGLFINRGPRIFWPAAAIVALNMILVVFDQFGVVDFFFSLVNAIILFILLVFRKEFLMQ